MGLSLPSLYSTKSSENEDNWNYNEDYKKKSMELWNNEIPVDSCGMKIANAIDRMGQGVVGECFDLCESTGRQHYMKLSPDNNKEQILISKDSADQGKTLSEILTMVSSSIAAPTKWLIDIDRHPAYKKDYLKLASNLQI